MAGRPVKNRTAKSYTSDIQVLQRLRTALLMDRTVKQEVRARDAATTAVTLIDDLCDKLIVLVDMCEKDVA